VTLLLGAVAGISLLVGGIGIMNIMLVLGGLIGVLLGIGASQLVAAFADFHAIVSVGSILLKQGCRTRPDRSATL
jgi:putative ABC transport system permease protein